MLIFHLFFSSCAVSNLKKVSLELGGKSPLIIFNDCELDKAVRMVRVGQVQWNRSLLLKHISASCLSGALKWGLVLSDHKQKPFSLCLDLGLLRALNFKNYVIIIKGLFKTWKPGFYKQMKRFINIHDLYKLM